VISCNQLGDFLLALAFMMRIKKMPVQLEPYQDSDSARAELVPFLMAHFQGEGSCTPQQWHQRLVFWWDENPFACAHASRGWVLRDAGKIVGYLGVIPTFYEDPQGRPIPALIASSWAVAPTHRHAVVPMGMKIQREGVTCVLVDTTPSPEVQQLLARWGWLARREMTRRLVPRGCIGSALAALTDTHPAPLVAGMEIITDVRRISAVHPARPRGQLQKHITPDYLRWYMTSPMRKHHFIGAVDQFGMVTSYLTVAPKPLRRVPTWYVKDWFTTRETDAELQSLVGWLMKNSPAEKGRHWPLISLPTFFPDDPWHGLPFLYSREENLCHCHSLPTPLKNHPFRHVIAEGDWGL
jgi:hypothetical protein